MSGYAGRLETLRERARAAQEGVAELSEDEWPDHFTRDRFKGILTYAESILQASDPDLISETAYGGLDGALGEIVASPPTAAANADLWGNRLLDALAILPVSRGREAEQAVKDIAATFQRSTQQRMAGLRAEFGGLKVDIDRIAESAHAKDTELRVALEERSAEFTEEVSELQGNFAAKLETFAGELSEERTALAALRGSQTTGFEEAEEQRARTARARLAEVDEELRTLQARVTAELDQRVAEIRRMEQESAQLVGAIGLAGTAERYAEEVRNQKDAADTWRKATVVFALLAVIGVIVAVVQRNPEAETFAGKLTLSLILGGIATYAARQSAAHRMREQRARDLQLELTAFSPFIEPLSPEQQEEERVIMTRKTFGKTTQRPAPEEEPGPTALSFLLRNKQAQQQADEDGNAPV